MYQEQLAKLTADHLRTHIKAYLDIVDAMFAGNDNVPLLVPKTIEPASLVGGMVTAFDKILPQYGIDVMGKQLAASDDSLWSYEYAGQINGLVHGGSQEAVDKLVKRHAAAVELFIRNHRVLHQEDNLQYRVVEFVFVASDFSGAEDLGEHDSGPIWLAGFSINVSWFTSEDGPNQHGT